MSQSDYDAALSKRKAYMMQWPEASEADLNRICPLPALPTSPPESKPHSPKVTKQSSKRAGGSSGFQPAETNTNSQSKQQNNSWNQTFTNSNHEESNQKTPAGGTRSRVGSGKALPQQQPSGPAPAFSCKKLADAEKARQDSIRQLVTRYLQQYPALDTTHAESIYRNEGKSVIYKAVTQMLADKRVPEDHFREAFAYYTWLPEYLPTQEDDPTKKTLLHYACFYGRSDVLSQLLAAKYQPDISAQDEKGFIALHTAAKSGNLDCLNLVFNYANPSLEARDNEGRTPLMVAAFFNQKDVVEQLLLWDANVVARDTSNNDTALDIAKKQGHSEVFNTIKNFQSAQSVRAAKDAALKRWLADRMHRRLYDAWQASPVPHTNAPVDSFIFSTTPVHNVEGDNIELVRMSRYDVSSARNYFATKARHNDLFLCLAYLAAPTICGTTDCQKRLTSYEEILKAPSGTVEVHPLYFLACARLAKDDLPLRKALLSDFVKKYPTTLGLTAEKGGWLTIEEENYLNDNSNQKEEETAPETLADKWAQLAKNAKLTKEQCEPMDELMKLTGLATVKELAMDLYMEAQENAKEGADKSAPREYNFAFLGNPGTGKTTVARILARILEATGLRAGHKVIEMTASDALRKGVTQFNSELAALTGGDGGIAPPPDTNVFRKGMNVEVKHGGKWFPGQISNVTKTKTPRPLPPAKPNEPPPVQQYDIHGVYDIVYPDGTEDTDMKMFDGTEQLVRVVSKETAAGGVLFLDEAYDLDPANLREGRHIMADIMKVAEDCRDKVSIILAGYKDDIENKLYAFNSGMRDRFRAITFDDFDENELREVWLGMCKTAGWTEASLPGQMSVSRVAARRLSQRRSVKGFANARSVRVLVNQSITTGKRRSGHNKMLIVEDVIGVPPTPERIPALGAALRQLHEQIGINQVKDAVHSLCEVARRNYDKELNGMKTDQIQLNRLFLGNPGTGKTTVAAIYGAILKNLQLLSKGDVIERKASDFIGAVVGGTEEKTKGILSLAKGCVLIIDEAYNLNDPHFGKIALNTIVENVNNAPGDDIAVIMLGYEKNMLAMLNEQNPGLRSRFDPTYAFRFDDFSDMELLQIFSSACNKDQLDVPIEIKCAAVKHLAKARSMKNFGNARAVMTLLGAAKSRMNSRIYKDAKLLNSNTQTMTLEDVLGEDANLKANPLQAIDELQGGNDEHGFRTVLRQLGNSINVCRLENRPVDPVGNFIFTGAPGTGKTTVASKMAKMLNAFGVLASDHVVITSALDLTGEYVGQSKKVIEGKMEEARGGVLFIDEAYKMGEGSYGDEVMVKLLGMLTEPEYNNGKTIVILAGYQRDMDRMLSRNAGMASRFNERIHFADWSEEQCANLVEVMGIHEKPIPFHFDGNVKSIIKAGFRKLLQRPNWANARDSESMYKYLKKSRDRRRSREMEANLIPPQKTPDNFLLFTDEDAKDAVAMFLRNRPGVSTTSQYDQLQQQMANNYYNNNNNNNEGPTAEDSGFANNDPPPPPPPSFGIASAKNSAKEAPPSPPASDDEADEPEPDLGEESENEDAGDDGDSGDATFTKEEKALMARDHAAYLARVKAEAAEAKALHDREAALAATLERLKREAAEEAQRMKEQHEEEMRQLQAAREAQLAEMARLAKLEADEKLRKAKEAEMERKRLELEEQEREKARQELERKREEARRILQEKKKLEAEQAAAKKRLEELRQKEVEAKKQEVIQTLGMCAVGFAWKKESGGYRCCGGGHFIRDDEVNKRYNELFGTQK